MSINLFVVSGNLGGDMEVRVTPNGKHIGTFSLPAKSGYGDHEKIAWVTCKILGERAQKLSPYLLKGLPVTVQGQFQLEEWEQDGVRRSKPVVIVNDMQLPPKSVSNSQQAPQPQPQAQAQYQQPANNQYQQQSPQHPPQPGNQYQQSAPIADGSGDFDGSDIPF